MAIEIERRFLVRDGRAVLTAGGVLRWQRIVQGYFGRIRGLRARVRVLTGAGGADRAVLTLKGPRSGPCRLEYEYPFGLDAARRMLRSLPAGQIIRKIRYEIRHDDGLLWSLDRFQGSNAGLLLAEVELDDPDQPVELPSWVGAEVTADPHYGNSRLARWPLAPRRLHSAA